MIAARLLSMLIATLLAGCATAPQKVVTQRVEVAVPVSCIDRSKIPSEPASKFAGTSAKAPVDEQVKALLIDRETGAVYGKRLRGVLEACVITDATSSADRSPSPVKP